METYRMKYLMESAWDYIIQEDYFEDFIESQDIIMTRTEMNYFCLSEEQKAYMKEEERIEE